jgi:hypothetical protein
VNQIFFFLFIFIGGSLSLLSNTTVYFPWCELECKAGLELSLVYFTADGQSTSSSWYRASLWGPWPDLSLTYCYVTMDMKSTSRVLDTDICLLLLMWEVSTSSLHGALTKTHFTFTYLPLKWFYLPICIPRIRLIIFPYRNWVTRLGKIFSLQFCNAFWHIILQLFIRFVWLIL